MPSPPNFHEWRPPSRLKVSVRCSRCSEVCRGRIDDLPKPSMMSVTFVRTADELLLDCCRSWENWARRWLTRCQERELVNATDALSVATSSSPLSLTAKDVTGLAGSKKTLFCP